MAIARRFEEQQLLHVHKAAIALAPAGIPLAHAPPIDDELWLYAEST